MGCCSSKLVEPSARTSGFRSGSTVTVRRGAPELDRSSLALAALPLARHCSDTSSSSPSSASISGGGYDSGSESEFGGFTASLSSAVLTGMGEGDELCSDAGSGVGGLPHQRRALASIKTTHRLRVGVLEGTTFLNQYIVIDTLGRGSFGKVKLCLNTGDDMLYAVKVVNTRLLRAADKSRLRARLASPLAPGGVGAQGPAAPDLRREVEVMRALDHPNLLNLYEVIEDRGGGKVLMVMEFAEGGAIVGRNTLTPERPLPEALAQFYFRQMAAGLAYLHEHHVVHGDVKPENVMLCGGGAVKIGDFGQSQFFDRRDTFRRTLGTPAYLAPEVAAGGVYQGRQADVWALGVSLYLFIFGELPFKGDSVLELYDAVATGDVPYPAHRPLSAELQDLFLRLLHRDPQHRITAAEVLHHPWVRGSVWQSAVREGSGEPGQAADQPAGERHPLVPYSAEDVAAVVFPSLLPHVDASPGRPRGGRTQLVDALAAAASAGLEDGMAERLAHSPPSRLHQLSQDSMLLRQGTGQEGSQDVGDAAAASEAQSSGANGMDSSRTPLLAGSAGSASSQEVGSQDHGSQGAAPGDFAADAAATRGAAAAGGLPAGSAEQALQLPQAGVSPRQQLRRLPLPSPFETQPSTLGRENGSQAFSAAEQPHAAPSGRPGEQAEVQKLRTAAPADSRDSLDGEQPRRARSAGVLPTLQSAQNGPTGGSASAQASPRSSDAGSLPRASSADGLPHGPGAAAAEATGPVQHRRAPSAVPFASLGDLVDVAMSSSPPPTGLPPRLPPRPPPPKPTAQHPMVVNIFRPGERLGTASANNQPQACFYVEQGVVELRYEADVPITLSSVLSAATNLFRRNTGAASAAATAPSPAATARGTDAGGGPASPPAAAAAAAAAAGATQLQPGQQAQQARQGASPTSAIAVAAGAAAPDTPLPAEVKAEPSEQGANGLDLDVPAELQHQGSQLMERSQSLKQTVAQATLRAKALLASARAKGGSLDHLLVSERTTGEFLGSLAMLDPHFLMGRWKATAVARTHVVALHMTREGLEAFLQQHPLAQVHLRASMARARAEVVKLEALEKIAVARQHQAQVQERPSRPRSIRSTASSARVPALRRASGGPLPWRPAQAAQPAAGAPAVVAAGAATAAAVAASAAVHLLPAGTPPAEAAAPAAAAAAAAAAATAAELTAEPASMAALQEAAGEVAAAPGGAAVEEEEELEEQLSEPVTPASSLSTASSSSLEEPPTRRASGITSDDAFSATIELFKVVSQLREAVSEQLRSTLEKRAGGAALAASALGSAPLPGLATAGSGSSG